MTPLLGFGFSGPELWVVLVVALLLFGHRIPGMARSLGAGIVEFKKGLKSGEEDDSAARIGTGESAEMTRKGDS